ncbi:hypothetical protein [Devosia sp. SL43]|uniref:hypothetical protein n=1 Tax=Devosia sp. SL43 TaxID=2806348 RepID=UPI001F171DAC|nr:hypothetical protein [Devosia sp. SL43]UJW85074.1 hypothetical protein IM737_16940 [Devosia sp. SL43]
MVDIPTDVRQVTSALIALFDTHLPGQLEAFYLTGSVAQGDYRHGLSDIDFVAVLGAPAEVTTLSAIHAQLAQPYRRPDCDGIYLLPGELSAPPAGEGISVRGGLVRAASGDERHPVAWLMLTDHGIALRGRQPDSRWLAADRAAAIAHSRQQSYWRNWLKTRRRLASVAGMALLSDDAVTWGALGVARLHATVQTGHVPSKSGAAEHALLAFPAHGRIITEALRLRIEPGGRSGYRTPLARRRDLILYMDTVIGSV